MRCEGTFATSACTFEGRFASGTPVQEVPHAIQNCSMEMSMGTVCARNSFSLCSRMPSKVNSSHGNVRYQRRDVDASKAVVGGCHTFVRRQYFQATQCDLGLLLVLALTVVMYCFLSVMVLNPTTRDAHTLSWVTIFLYRHRCNVFTPSGRPPKILLFLAKVIWGRSMHMCTGRNQRRFTCAFSTRL